MNSVMENVVESRSPPFKMKNMKRFKNASTFEEFSIRLKRKLHDAKYLDIKMEHFKKRLIHQHEKPYSYSSDLAKTDDHINDDDDRSISPIVSRPISQHMPNNNNNNKLREEKAHTRVAKKRAVCRGKFRHENMEIFKLGASIPSSLCKTKDPYNVCTEKNLQMSCQNLQQNSRKPEEHLPKEAITNYIINSIEGKGRKDTLQRSLSLNNERNDSKRKLNSTNNTKDTVDTKNSNSGRHILPAIVPEVVSDTRRKKMSKGTDDPRKEENDHTKKSAEQSQKKRQSKSRRRQTVIGTEKSNNVRREDTVAEDGQKAADAPPQRFQPANEIFTSSSSSMNNFPTPPRYQAVPVSENSAFPLGRPLPQSLRPASPTSNTSNSNYPMVYENPSNTQISGFREAQDLSQYAANKNSNYLSSDSIRNAQQFVPTSSYNVVADTSIPNYHINAASLEVPSSSQNEQTWKLPGNRYETRNFNDANGEKLQEDPINLSVKEQMNRQLSNKRKSSEQRAGSSMPENLAKTKDDDPSQSNIWAFPRIREQISRMGHPNQPPSNNNNKELARAKTLEKMSQDIAIRATIDRAKAAMTQPFSLERLFEMNQSYRDLQFYLIKRNVSKILKLAITATINELITYVSYKIFGKRDSMNFRIYSEKIMEVELAQQKPILYDFLNLGISRSEDEVTINAYIKVIRGETSRPTLPLPRVPPQESLGYNLPSFQPQFIPPQHSHAGRRQQDGAMLINHRPYSGKPTNSRPFIPESYRQSQDMLHHFPRPSNDMRVPAHMHHQKPEDLYHTDNGCIPQTHQKVRQTFANAPKEPTRISREDECIDISNEESTVTPVATTRRRRNSSGQDVEELLPPNIIIGKEIFNGNGHKEAPVEETRHQNGVSKKDSITKTVIVRDNSMEITKGDRHSKISKKPISEFVLEKIQRPPDKKDEVIKLDIKKEPPEKDSKNSAQDDLQIFKKYLLEEDKTVYKNVMKKVVHEKEAKEKPQVIMIVDDEDMQIQKVPESTAPSSDKSIEPPSRKKLKTNITQKQSFVETLVVDDEDPPNTTNKQAEDRDLNQNYIPSKNNNAKGIKRVCEPENKSYLNHMPVIEDISSDDEPIQPVQSYRSYGHMTNASAIMESEPHSVTRALSTHSENDAGVKSFTHERPSLATEPREKPAELNPSNRRKEKQNANVSQFSVDLEPRKQDGSPLSSPSVRFSSTPNNFPPHFPQKEGIHPQSYGPPIGIGALSPAVSKSPAMAESPGCSNPALPLMQGKYGPHWQAWFSEERKRDFFDLDQNPSGSRRQSVETISSVGSDYSPNVAAEQNLVEIKVDSKWYRIKKSLYDKIPKGKLCYIRETNSFLRYFDDNQMEQFIENLDPASETRAFSNFMKQFQERVDSQSNFDTYLGGLEQNEIIALPKEPNFSRYDFICDPENYVKEVLKVEQVAPRDFLGFYKFVTGYQIIHNNHPISFQTFLSIHSTNGMKKLFNQYLHNLLGKKVYANNSS